MPPELVNQVQSGILFAAQGRMSQISVNIGGEDGKPVTVRLVFLPDDLGKMRMVEQKAFVEAEENAKAMANKAAGVASPEAAVETPKEPLECGNLA